MYQLIFAISQPNIKMRCSTNALLFSILIALFNAKIIFRHDSVDDYELLQGFNNSRPYMLIPHNSLNSGDQYGTYV